ncbi:MAG TPA: hypothetical protein VHQ47_12945 [Phycisphaerae bacterium]|nr:hypothetical protein [Phycisphaerae bacterium]
MGCCLIAIIGALWPRVLLVLIYFFAHQIPQRAFHTVLLPLLGFIFLPATTLVYELCVFYGMPPNAAHPLAIIFIALAFLSDLSQLGATRRRRRA